MNRIHRNPENIFMFLAPTQLAM